MSINMSYATITNYDHTIIIIINIIWTILTFELHRISNCRCQSFLKIRTFWVENGQNIAKKMLKLTQDVFDSVTLELNREHIISAYTKACQHTRK